MKLHKNFSTESATVEAMWDSCLNGCSCSVVSCYCGTYESQSYSLYSTQQKNHTAAFKNGAY